MPLASRCSAYLSASSCRLAGVLHVFVLHTANALTSHGRSRGRHLRHPARREVAPPAPAPPPPESIGLFDLRHAVPFAPCMKQRAGQHAALHVALPSNHCLLLHGPVLTRRQVTSDLRYFFIFLLFVFAGFALAILVLDANLNDDGGGGPGDGPEPPMWYIRRVVFLRLYSMIYGESARSTAAPLACLPRELTHRVEGLRLLCSVEGFGVLVGLASARGTSAAAAAACTCRCQLPTGPCGARAEPLLQPPSSALLRPPRRLWHRAAAEPGRHGRAERPAGNHPQRLVSGSSRSGRGSTLWAHGAALSAVGGVVGVGVAPGLMASNLRV